RFVTHDAVALHHVALDVDGVPFLSVPDIVDRHVVVLAPEERCRPEWCFHAHHVERRDLPLPLGDDPVLDANALTRNGIGPTRDIAGRVDARRARLHEFVHCHALVDREARAFGECKARAHAYSDHHEIGFERAAALERHALAFDRGKGILEMEFDAMLFVQRTDEIAELRPEYAFERTLLR